MAHELSPSEQLTYSTVRIQCDLKGGGVSTGTGFFYRFLDDGHTHVPAVVTNKHVVAGAVDGRFLIHEGSDGGGPHANSNITVSLTNFESLWIKHPDPDVDLCILPISPVVSQAAKQGKQIFFIPLDRTLVPSVETQGDFTAIEEIVMVGYPIGIWDSINNLPIIRRGITATHPAKDYEGKSWFLIDAACFPGSSGSPVLLFNLGSYPHKSGGIVMGSRIFLLGVLFAGHQYNSKGEVTIENVPTGQKLVSVSSLPINLGICVKAARLHDFESIIQSVLPPASA